MSWSLSASGKRPEIRKSLANQIKNFAPVATANEAWLREKAVALVKSAVLAFPITATLSVSASGALVDGVPSLTVTVLPGPTVVT